MAVEEVLRGLEFLGRGIEAGYMEVTQIEALVEAVVLVAPVKMQMSMGGLVADMVARENTLQLPESLQHMLVSPWAELAVILQWNQPPPLS